MMKMHWVRCLLLLAIPLIASTTSAQETEPTETTTLENNDVSTDLPSSESPPSESPPSESSPSESSVQLNSDLRNALLKALTELEGEDGDETQDYSDQYDEQNIKKAQASAITYFANDEEQALPLKDPQNESNTSENQIIPAVEETTNNSSLTLNSSEEISDIGSTQNPNVVLVQKSDGIQGIPITSFEKEPIDFLKDAEQIITSASNSFVTQNDEPTTRNSNSHEARSIRKDEESIVKITSFNSDNDITGSDGKAVIGDEKEVNEPPFAKIYVRPLGNNVNDDVKSTESFVKSFNSKTSAFSDVKSVKDTADSNTKSNEDTTSVPPEVSTEENEAKVEQVQFFSAPLVAAFTVHQDEKGQPKKVEPIYKNEFNPKKQNSALQQNLPQQNAEPDSSSFSNLDLQKKQQILEQELEKLRNQQLLQQERLRSRNNFVNAQSFGNQNLNNQGLTPLSFRQAVNQNFNQYEPIFTEPDRSIVTKLATVDPNTLLAQNGGPFLNRFTPSEAILPLNNPVAPKANEIVPNPKPISKNSNTKGDVTLVPSISYDPLVEAGKLPLNAQILPNKEPTGFLNFVPTSGNSHQPKTSVVQNSFTSLPVGTQTNKNLLQNNPSASQVGSNVIQPISNFVQHTSNYVQPNSNLIQTNSNFAQPNFNAFSGNSLLSTQQQSIQPNQNQVQSSQNLLQSPLSPTKSNIGSFGSFVGQNSFNQPNRYAEQSGTVSFLRSNLDSRGQNTQFLTPNRFLGQEQAIGNPGFNQNTFSITQSQQPFGPRHETDYFPDNTRLLRQNQESTFGQSQNFLGTNQVGQNTRFFRNNLEATHSANAPNQNLGFQGVQNQFIGGNSQTQNRPFRSNLEGQNSFNIQQTAQHSLNPQNTQSNRFFRSNQESFLAGPQTLASGQNLGFGHSQNFGKSDQNNRFLRSNLEGTLSSNSNRFLSQPILQNYRYSNSFGFSGIPLNKK